MANKKQITSRATTQQSAEKLGFLTLFCRGASYRSGEPLRHPKTRAKSSFSASCSAAPHRLIKNAGFLAFW
jgi:hypothetical protein